MNDRLLVLNRDDNAVSVVDPETGETTASIETDFDPSEIETSPDGSKSYVTCSRGNSMNVIDNDSFEVTSRTEHELFDFPVGLVVRDEANELWLVSRDSSQVFVFDMATDELLEVISTHQEQSHMIALGAGEVTAYVANLGGNTITVIDCEERHVSADIPVGNGPEGIAVNPRTDEVYVANQQNECLLVLEPDRLEEQSQTSLGGKPTRIVFSPNARYAFVPNRRTNDVSVIDTRFERNGDVRPWEIKRVPVGISPGGIVFDSDGATAYVANTKTNDVSVIDVDARKEVRRIDVGIHPDGITYLER